MNFKRWSALLSVLMFVSGCAARKSRVHVGSAVQQIPEQRTPEVLAPSFPPPPRIEVVPREVKPTALVEEQDAPVPKPVPPRAAVQKKPVDSKPKRPRVVPVTAPAVKEREGDRLEARWRPDVIHIGLGVVLLAAGGWIVFFGKPKQQ